MSDQKRNPQQDQEMEELKKLHEKTLEGLNLQNDGYRCVSCNNRVMFNFPLPALKAASLCPDCWNKDPDEIEEDKILEKAEEIKEKRKNER